ncbi:chemosensory receptor a [Plakobranchus ocellatus]|uniref:Chemosensory receptor a n=1 Tax=Plakobranchus ocellatus TaxID=259542 RepID=A0AAV3YUK7_9GAST|nr:chemosensory receptor a [Plakobranchus ocellatus]
MLKNNKGQKASNTFELIMNPTEEENTSFSAVSEGRLQVWDNQSKDPSVYISASGFLNDRQFGMISLVLVSISQLCSVVAVISNSLSITVFVRLGFSEPSNISLVALAASDLACAVLLIWANSCFLLSSMDVRLPFDATNVSYLTGSIQWAFISRTVAWITAFISFERCLCILVPLKVKKLITSKSTLTAMIVIFIFTFCPGLNTFIRYRFRWVFYPYMNVTILDVVPLDNESIIQMDYIITVICGFIQPLLAFFIVLMCTIFLVIQLRKLSSWRKSVTSAKSQWQHKPGEDPAPNSPPTQDRSFRKEERLVRMVVAIATIFIVSYTPTCIMLLCSTIFDEFFFFGVYKRMYIVCGMATFLAQTISGGVNILIYYYMASKFRLALRCLLRLDRQEHEK